MLSRSNNICFRPLIGLILMLSATVSFALELGPVKVHGFVNQVYLNTDGNNYLGDTINGSWDYQEAGLNLSYRPFNKIRLATQVISRDVGNYDPNEDPLKLDYAIASYKAFTAPSNEITVSIGKMKLPQGFYSDALDAPVNRNGILLPQVMYYDYSRNNYLGINGVRLNVKQSFDFGDFEHTLIHGKSNTSKEILFNDINNNLAINNITTFDSDIEVSRSRGWQFQSVFYSADMNWKIGAQYRSADSSEIVISTNSNLGPITVTHQPISNNELVFSIERLINRHTVTGEYYRSSQHNQSVVTSLFGLTLLEQTLRFTYEGYYIQDQYSVNSEWTFLLRYEGYKNPKNQNEIVHLAWVTGVTWSPISALKIKAEFHQVEGTALVNLADNPDPALHQKHWSIFGLSASYQF